MEHTKNIAKDLKIILVVVIAISSILFIVIDAVIYFINTQKNYEQRIHNTINTIKKAYPYPLWTINVEQINSISKGMLQNNIVEGIKVIEYPQGEIIFQKNKHKFSKREDSYNYRIRTVPIFFNKERVGTVEVYFSFLSQQLFMQKLVLTNLINVTIILFVVFISTDWILKRLINEPLDYLIGILDKISEGEYIKEFSLSKYEEINRIISCVQKLAQKVHLREQELKQSEQKFRKLTESSPAGIFIYLYSNERFVYCNRASESISGYSRDELLCMKFWEIVHPDFVDLIKELAKEKREGEIIQYEIKILSKGGEERWVKVASTALEYMGKRGRILVFIDVTQERKAEAEVESLRNLLGSIINSMPSYLITIDRELKVVQWNKQVDKLLQKKSLDPKSNSLLDIFPSLTPYIDKIHQAIEEQRVFTSFKNKRVEDGEIHFENIQIFPILSNGIEGAVIRIDDVTREVKLEEIIFHSDKMASLGQMAAGVAHEINNPLAIIMQSADIAMRRLTPVHRENYRAAEILGVDFGEVVTYCRERKIVKMLGNIKEASIRAADIVKGLLVFSRKPVEEPDAIDVREVLESALAMAYSDYDLKKRYDVKKIHIVKEYEENLPRIWGDFTKLQQVFLNIIKNGAHAMAGMPAPVFRFQIKRKEDKIVVKMQDNGRGIEENIKKRIFDPFFTTKEVGEGTGLGLYVAYFIITQYHRGTIEVESEPGKGTTFTIQLPITTAIP